MASPEHPRRVEVRLDGRPIPSGAAGDDVRGTAVEVRASRLYGLARIPGPVRRHRLELRLQPGVRAYAFTFG
jgi:hypothetical protein